MSDGTVFEVFPDKEAARNSVFNASDEVTNIFNFKISINITESNTILLELSSGDGNEVFVSFLSVDIVLYNQYELESRKIAVIYGGLLSTKVDSKEIKYVNFGKVY